MDNLTEMCFLCFSDNKLTNVPLDVKTAAQVKYIVPEFINPKATLHICRLCSTMLQGFYKFKVMCLENYNRMKMFLDDLEETSDTEQTNSMEHEKQEDIENINITIKQEVEDVDNNDKKNEELLMFEEDQSCFAFESVFINENLAMAQQCVSEADNAQECSSSIKKQIRSPPGEEAATSATLDFLPNKSKEKYEFAYRRFMEYRLSKDIDSTSENVVIEYFADLGTKVKAPTLWSNYSMLKSTLQINENIDIAKYKKLRAYLKHQSDGYTAKKSKVLTREHIQQFIEEASDDTFLATKMNNQSCINPDKILTNETKASECLLPKKSKDVYDKEYDKFQIWMAGNSVESIKETVLLGYFEELVAIIFGIAGACRRDELVHMNINDIEDLGSKLLITIPDNNTNKPRSFIVNEMYLAKYRKYTAARPPEYSSSRFFYKYAMGKGWKQVIGIHQFGRMPQVVASFLNLPNPKEYTAHCFRRSSSTILMDNGTDLNYLKKKKMRG